MKSVVIVLTAAVLSLPVFAQPPATVSEAIIEAARPAAEDDPAATTVEAPSDPLAAAEKALAEVQAEREALQAEISPKMTELAKKKHEAEYADPACAKIREEIVELEGRLVELRQQLAAQQLLVPGIAEVNEQRRELIEKIQALSERERVLQNEVRSLRIRAPEAE